MTPGATVYCTNSTTGSAPAAPSYNTSNYMPTYGSQTFILGTAGTSGITAGHAFQPSFAIYGPMQISCMAAEAGMTDSAVASASYSLSGPAGTPISACTTTLTGTNYLTADVSSAGTCMGVTAANTVLNLNGHTITYGTGSSTVLSGSGCIAVSGSNLFVCPNGGFTSAMNGNLIYGDNYNTGGFQNFGDVTTMTYVNSTTVTLNHPAVFSSINAEFFVAGPKSFGIACDPSQYGNCTAMQAYNGTITQGSGAAPGSNAIEVNPHGWGGAGGPFVWANLNINVSQPEALAIFENETTGADLIANNTINDSVATIYYRDGLQYPIKLDNGGQMDHAGKDSGEQYHPGFAAGRILLRLHLQRVQQLRQLRPDPVFQRVLRVRRQRQFRVSWQHLPGQYPGDGDGRVERRLSEQLQQLPEFDFGARSEPQSHRLQPELRHPIQGFWDALRRSYADHVQ